MTNWNMPYWQTKQTKDYQNKLRGARSKAMGDAWEVMLSNACDAYRKAGIADIQKTPEPFRVTRNLGKGRFEGHFIHCAQPDYKGIMMNGQGIIFEAKYTDHDRIMQRGKKGMEYSNKTLF